MARISISEAARLTGKNRSTLHRHIKSGKLSKHLDDDNNPLLDTSELSRIYQSFKVHVALPQVGVISQSNSMQQAATPNKIRNAAAEIELLKLKLQHAEEKVSTEENRRHESEQREQEAKEEIGRLLAIVEKQTYLLAAPPKVDLPEKQSPKGWFRRLFD
ncbi:hypothetical protein [Dyadobacter psychrophilus]|uniref:Helix-turn-helix domain-containing protein n=1 Tax=Dyadobacter psychrophilus TaxID=651661 RepID=A0A1T5HJK9_9BACT|nr:hypothetical protein [Dyadobacter psychrophilus]SKC20875.1 hypothetical protein SAMN05660293_05736 [Dyadobacter psychrophilus]